MNPDKYTIQEIYLDVSDGHKLYVQEWGNPKAKTPILIIHGGPGNGVDDRDKKDFDPKIHRVIFYDQRCSGNSTPLNDTVNNTTPKLVEDIEAILEKLNVNECVIIGGSWGSTLALAYALEHPKRIKSLVINGVFTGSKSEADWIIKGGWKVFYPEIWQNYASTVPEEFRNDPSSYHLNELDSGDPERIKKSAYAFESMELALLKLDEIYRPSPFETYEPKAILVEMNYDKNNFYFPENHILNNAHMLQMPVHIIQGRFDMVTPPKAAYELSKIIPNCKLYMTINGHLRQHESLSVQSLILDQILGNE